MRDLQEATVMICRLKGSAMATLVFIDALVQVLPPEIRQRLSEEFEQAAEICRAQMLPAQVSEATLSEFERDVLTLSARVAGRPLA